MLVHGDGSVFECELNWHADALVENVSLISTYAACWVLDATKKKRQHRKGHECDAVERS